MADSPYYRRAKILWDESGQPLSSQFDDVYFSKANGLEETRHVFLDGNQLNERFRRLTVPENFCVFETGFGTGLNFLACWELWQKRAPEGCRLHFISVEKFPLSRQDLRRALSLWPALSPLSSQLIAAYEAPRDRAWMRAYFDSGKVCLTLIFDDALTALVELRAQTSQPGDTHEVVSFGGPNEPVNAWFLDGFAPSKNPELWQAPLFSNMALLSARDATVATFTAAGNVRRGLDAAGFAVEKRAGFGRKREMVVATLSAPKTNLDEPWRAAWHTTKTLQAAVTSCTIVGAGLAGCLTARSLANFGIRVTVLERQSEPARAASGNHQAVLYGKMSPASDVLARFNAHAMNFAIRHYRELGAFERYGQECGVFYQAKSEKERESYQRLAVQLGDASVARWTTPEEASELTGVQQSESGLWIPEAGWLSPRALCEDLLEHPAITLNTGADVQEIIREDSEWRALDVNGRELARAQALVIANANDALKLKPSTHLPLRPIRGQVTYIPDEFALLAKLKAVICGDGYCAPAFQGLHSVGASFNLGETSDTQTEADHRDNLRRLEGLSEEFAGFEATPPTFEGRVGFRCTTPDYLPLCGPLPNVEAMTQTFAPWRRDASLPLEASGHFYPNLYCHVGHGSRGLAYAPLCADILASIISGRRLPVANSLYRFLHPARFLIRDIVRNKR